MANEKQINPNLTDEQKRVLFDKGTEVPGTGEYLNHSETGMYTCANCGAELFKSDAKYDSRTPGLIGWPSFADPATNDALELRPDIANTRLAGRLTLVVVAAVSRTALATPVRANGTRPMPMNMGLSSVTCLAKKQLLATVLSHGISVILALN